MILYKEIQCFYIESFKLHNFRIHDSTKIPFCTIYFSPKDQLIKILPTYTSGITHPIYKEN